MAELPKTWDDWIENFGEWQDRVGFDREWLGDFDLSILFDWDRAGEVIEFGDILVEQSGREHYKSHIKISEML